MAARPTRRARATGRARFFVAKGAVMTYALPSADKRRRLLYTTMVSDVLDGFGLMQLTSRPFARPLDEALAVFGPARTGHYEPATMLPGGPQPSRTGGESEPRCTYLV
jgi:hypothetical protein